MQIPVEAGFLYSIRAQASFTWRKMLCELIDNSLDASASEVHLEFPGGKVFRIRDNGVGTEDLMRLITLGKRKDHVSNDVGKYGVGCKQALIWLWGASILESTTQSGSQLLEINWEQIADGLVAYPAAALINTAPTFTGTGTRIQCMGDKTYPNMDKLRASLSATYTPGIEAGKVIWLKQPGKPGSSIKSRAWPKTDRMIDDAIEAAGRSVKIKMGIVSAGVQNPYGEGFSFERTYRVIKESTLGANGFAVSRIAARITLGNEWELSTNKDDFTEYQDELAEAIYDRCCDLMAEASDQAVTIEDSAFNKELASIIEDSAGKTRKESRPGPKVTEGTAQPKHTGGRRQHAKESTDAEGSVLDAAGKTSRRRGFTIETYVDTDGSMTFGRYDADGNRVRLNIGNPWLCEMHRSQNTNALLPVLYGILSDAAIRRQSERMPLFIDQSDDLVTQWGSCVASASMKGQGA